jgi:ammonium transporter Rh
MILVGFGFLMTFLSRYGFSAVGFNFMITAFAIQWAILTNGFWHCLWAGHWETVKLDITSLITGDFTTGAVLITFGGLLGKVSPLQLLVIAMLECIVFGANETIGALELGAVDMGGSIFVHTFGAYFGLAAAWMIGGSKAKGHPLNKSSKTSDTFAMIGTLFLWMFWPSFNGALATGSQQHRVVINTVLSLCASAMAAFLFSAFLRKHHKFDMVDIQNATLAGGVAVGSSSDLVIQPWGALLVGFFAGALSVVGYVYISPFLERKIGLHDTCGIHNLHGMPGIMGALGGAVSAATAGSQPYGTSIGAIFPNRLPTKSQAIATGLCTSDTECAIPLGEGLSAGEQAGVQVYALLITLTLAIVGGLISGWIAKLPVFQPPHALYDDSLYWEVPEEEDDK